MERLPDRYVRDTGDLTDEECEAVSRRADERVRVYYQPNLFTMLMN